MMNMWDRSSLGIRCTGAWRRTARSRWVSRACRSCISEAILESSELMASRRSGMEVYCEPLLRPWEGDAKEALVTGGRVR